MPEFRPENRTGLIAVPGPQWDNAQSPKFKAAWDASNQQGAGRKLGYSTDNGGGEYVHDSRGLQVQDFLNTDPATRYGTDGRTMIVSDEPLANAYVVKEGFLGAYKCIKAPLDDGPMGGAAVLGAPLSTEHPALIGDNCEEYMSPVAGASQVAAFQKFEKGCLWWRGAGDPYMHVHLDPLKALPPYLATKNPSSDCSGVQIMNNDPGPGSCVNDCVPGTSQCAGSSAVRICGFPGTDTCYHWLTLACSEGMHCQDGACAAASGGGGGAATCAEGARRCDSSANYGYCSFDSATGTTSWKSAPCGSGWSCQGTTGQCAPAQSSCTFNTQKCTSASTVAICQPDGYWATFNCDNDSYCNEAEGVCYSKPAVCDLGAQVCDSSGRYAVCQIHPSTGKPYWQPWPCEVGTECISSTGRCTALPIPTNAHEISCVDNDSTFDLTFKGPIQDLLWTPIVDRRRPVVELYSVSGALIGSVQLESYVPGGKIVAGNWYEINIPVTGFSIGSSTVGGLSVMSDLPGPMYIDDLKFMRSGAVTVYGDWLASGWQDWSWSVTRTYGSTERISAGSSAIKVVYTAPWGGLYLHKNSALSSNMNVLHFAFNGGSTGGQHPQVQAFDANQQMIGWANVTDYVRGGTIVPNTWYQVDIPLSALGVAPGSGTLRDFAIMSNVATTAYIDDIRFESDEVVYSDGLAPGWQDWSWSTTRTYGSTEQVNRGTNALKVTYNASWGGLYLHTDTALASLNGATLHVSLHAGPPGGAGTFIEYGSSHDGWTAYAPGVPGGKPSAQWTGDLDDAGLPKSFTITIDEDVQELEFFTYNPHTGEEHWVDQSSELLTVTGTCTTDGVDILH